MSDSTAANMKMDSMGDVRIPLYVCHKRVRALKIKKVYTDEDGQGVVLTFEDERFPPRAVTRNLLEHKPVPEAGMYLVLYENSYFSFSPADVFESGYTREEEGA